MTINLGDESLVPILGNEVESVSPSVSTRVSQNETTNGSHVSHSSTSCLAAVFLTVNATLGAGLLNIPHAFNDSGGIYSSLIVQTVSSTIVNTNY